MDDLSARLRYLPNLVAPDNECHDQVSVDYITNPGLLVEHKGNTYTLSW